MTTPDHAKARFRADFAEMLNYHRTVRGWSKLRLADEAGLSNGTVNPILNKRDLATHASITALLEAIGATQDDKDNWHARRQELETPPTMSTPPGPDDDPDKPRPETPEEAARADRPPQPPGEPDPDDGPWEGPPAPPSPEPPDNPQNPHATPNRQRFPSGRWLVAALVLLLVGTTSAVLGTVAWVTSMKEINGRVRCQSGAPVVGAWTRWGPRTHNGQGVDVRPGTDGWYTFNGHTRTHHTYELHFGCGSIPDTTRWKTIGYSPAGLSAGSLTLVCDDSPPTVSQPPYRAVCTIRTT